MCPNLSATIKKVQTTALMTRIVTESQVDKLKQVLGTCFGIAHTKPVPTMKAIKESNGLLKPTVHVRDIDEVRAMTCLDNTSAIENLDTLSDVEVFKALLEIDGFDPNESVLYNRLCPYDGVDIEHITSETGVTDLHFNVKFKTVLGSSLVATKAQTSAYTGKHKQLELQVGQMLKRPLNGKDTLCNIRSICRETKRVKLDVSGFESDGTAESIDIEEATSLVKEHNKLT